MSTTYKDLLTGIKTQFDETIEAWSVSGIPYLKDATSKNITLDDWNRFVVLLSQTQLFVDALYPVINGWISAAEALDTTLAEHSETLTKRTSKEFFVSTIGDADTSQKGLMTTAHVNTLQTLAAIDDASKDKRGYMTPTQVEHLATLVELLKNKEATVDTITEVLSAFEQFSEGKTLVTMLAEKLEKSHSTDPSAHSDLFDGEKKAREDADKALGERLQAIEGIGDATSVEYGYMTPEQVSDLKTLLDIGDATDTVRGYMTPEQVQALEMLMALFEDDADTVIDTIKEVLAAFENAPEGVNIAYVLDELRTLISDESAARKKTDSDLADEVKARTDADTALDGAIIEQRELLQTEVRERKAADASLARTTTTLTSRVGLGEKRLENLEARLSADAFVTDATVAYQKTVPANALPYAILDKIGGATTPKNLFAGVITQPKNDNPSYSLRVDEVDSTILYLSSTVSEFDREQGYWYLGELYLPEGEYTMRAEGIPSGSLYVSGPDYYEDSGDGTTFYWRFGLNEPLSIGLSVDFDKSYTNKVIKLTLVKGDKIFSHAQLDKTVKVTEVVSESANLFDINNPDIVAHSQWDYSNYPLKIENGVIYSAGIASVASGQGILFDVRGLSKVFVSMDASFNPEKEIQRGVYARVGDVISGSILSATNYFYFTINEKTKFEVNTEGVNYVLLQFSSNSQHSIAITNLMVSAEDVPYQPYGVLDTFPIPAEVQELEGYGEANPDNSAEANYIDFERRKFVAYGYMNNGAWVAYTEPQETPISAHLSDDNFIRVGGGGTLTFVNEHSVDVPSTVTYQRKEVAV